MSEPRKSEQEQKPPGHGVDRTLMRKLLALTPAERARIAVQSTQNLVALKAKLRWK